MQTDKNKKQKNMASCRLKWATTAAKGQWLYPKMDYHDPLIFLC